MRFDHLSKYRGVFMGLATLWIVLLHSTAWFSSFLFGYLKATGYCGVDVFLILSSLGLTYAWKRCNGDIKTFYLRRFFRIMPVYWFVALIRCFMEATGKRYFVLLASTLSFWILDDLSMWYVAAITVFYLLSPLFLKCLNGTHWKRDFGIFFVIAFAAGILMKPTPQNLFFTRIPSFLLGFLIAKRCESRPETSGRERAVLTGLFLAGTVLMILCQKGIFAEIGFVDWLVRWYGSLLFNVPLMLMIGALLEKIPSERKRDILIKPAAVIGGISLEMYLWFEVLLRYFRGSFLEHLPLEYHGVVYSGIILLMTIAVSYLTHVLIHKLTSIRSRLV